MAWWNELGLGTRVDKSAVTVPAGASTVDDDLFIITGGRILLTSIIGRVTVIIAVVTTMTISLRLLPTTGAAVTTALCIGLDCNTDNVDTIYTIPGGVGAALVDDARAGVAIASFDTTNKQILQPGAIEMRSVNVGGTGSGAVRWTLHYIPIDDAALVVSA